jgi:circadian clock protein KaiC
MDDNGSDQFIFGISSLIDAFISLRNLESNGERHRGLFILKSAGCRTPIKIRSLSLTDDGIKMVRWIYRGVRVTVIHLQ